MSAVHQLSDTAATELREIADAELHAHGRSLQAVGTLDAATASADFCRIWPVTKTFLGALATFGPAIPGFGTAVAIGIRAVIAMADAVYASTCHASASDASKPAPQ